MATWQAPGRVNLIGEHVDYCGGLVLPFALAMSTKVSVVRRSNGRVLVRSDQAPGPVTFPLHAAPGEVRGWPGYVSSVVWSLLDASPGDQHVLSSKWGASCDGLQIDITSDLPVGAGLASSASLECAVAAAINDECGLGLSRRELAEAAHQAETRYVGAPTSVMDQIACMLCEPRHALLVDCRTQAVEQVPLDLDAAGLTLLVIDTGVPHELVDSEYGDRRAACESAAAALGLALRDATLDQVEAMANQVPRRRATHVVTEIGRVRDVAAILRAGRPGDIGAFLTASHLSLRDDFEVSCDELDETVDAALSVGALGARMTGAGFGGCAIALCRNADVGSFGAAVRAAYDARGWTTPRMFSATASAGAGAARA
ncbi:MAG: galactokinase [Nocardioidaceae bacterium]